ncbi:MULTISPECIES: HesA/MoeB/ThiF family protein [Haloferacaceae]|uniref:HesA/MoeB/ThiF family protein n=1 Tax=Halorubrum glutamatedens TaxID=2707018 RepID=A0ABD5QMK7_9EURY|nr:ThiF family adenylyltransferase [Halobellus captivus]
MNLTLPAPVLQQLRTELVQDDELERFAYLYCGQTGDDLLAAEVHPVDRDDLEVISEGACRPDLDVERGHIEACINEGLVPIMVHSHPFADTPGFSGVDVATIGNYHTWLAGLYPDTVFGFIVIGRNGIATTVYDPDQDTFVDLPVTVLGEWMVEREWTLPSEHSDTAVTVDHSRYDRNIRAVTEDGQQAVASSSVAVVGCGGIGSVLVEQLARLGVKEFTLIDPDSIEASNLPRLVGSFPEHVDRPKVTVLQNHLWHIAPECEVTTVQQPVQDAAEHLDDIDVILAGVDQVSARMWLNEYAVRHLTPYIDAGSIIETGDDEVVETMDGYVQTIVPGVNACFDCLDRGDHEQARLEQLTEDELEEQIERGYVDESQLVPEPAVIHLNGTVASSAVNEFTKLVTGFDVPADFIRYDGLDNDVTEVSTHCSSTCLTCSNQLGRGDYAVDDDPAEGDPPGTPNMA